MDPLTPSRGAPGLDHLVFAVPDLDSGVATVEARLGVETRPGGRHQGLGSRNRLVGLGPGRYLEVVSVDPDQPPPPRPRWFGLDDLPEPRLVTWCVKAPELERVMTDARKAGLDLGEAVEGSRERPDGSVLTWTFSDPRADRGGGVVPFFIDWGAGAHPADDLPAACACVDVRLEHPEPARIAAWLEALGLDTEVSGGHAPRVIATLDTPNGIVELS